MTSHTCSFSLLGKNAGHRRCHRDRRLGSVGGGGQLEHISGLRGGLRKHGRDHVRQLRRAERTVTQSAVEESIDVERNISCDALISQWVDLTCCFEVKTEGEIVPMVSTCTPCPESWASLAASTPQALKEWIKRGRWHRKSPWRKMFVVNLEDRLRPNICCAGWFSLKHMCIICNAGVKQEYSVYFN